MALRGAPIADFALERFFARWEFAAPHLLCASDVQGWGMAELLELADEETRALWEDLSLGYTEAAGHPLLRAEIAALYESVAPAEVLVFAGAEEAIFAFMQVALEAGDHLVALTPAYQSLHEVARARGARVELHPLEHERGWALEPDELRARLRPETRALVVNFPHNPTGALPSRAAWRELIEAARGGGVRLFSDEVYRLLEYDPEDRLPAAVDLDERAVSLGVMSKAFALAGLRIGWVATHDAELLRRLAAFKDYLSICGSAPGEILALIALRARERVLARSRAILAANLARLDRFFAEWHNHFEWVRPRAGEPVERFAAALREEEGVLLAPGALFGHPGQHFRLGLGRTDLPEALARLERFAERRLRAGRRG